MKLILILGILIISLFIFGCTEQSIEQIEQITEPEPIIEEIVEEPTEEIITPSVTVSDQEIKDNTVIIEKVVAAEQGWIVIHKEDGPVLGHAAVQKGDNNNVIVNIDKLKATPTISAMIHIDKGIIGEYEFPGADGPVKVDEVIVDIDFKATNVQPEPEPVPEPIIKEETKEFEISADEKAFKPSTITVNKGDKVKITFNFNDANIYRAGLDVRSDYFDIQYRKGDTDKSQTVEFTAEESFTYTGYWPASNTRKASGKVEVK